ncbi:MAG: carboxypeptidase-like regulatory domain-containing protein [bacterium]
MKIKALILAAGIAFTSISTYADNNTKKDETSNATTTCIKGKIIDVTTGEALPGVKVNLDDYQKKAYTDFDGNFIIENLKPGGYDIEVSYISYKDVVKKIKVDDSSKELRVELEKVE